MRNALCVSTLAVALLVSTNEARADANVHSADALQPGDNMGYAELGWPELSVGFQHGLSDNVDIGCLWSLVYGFEYLPYVAMGVGVRVPIRITPVKSEKVSFQVRLSPGIKFERFGSPQGCVGRNCAFFFDDIGGVSFGAWLGVALDVGVHFTRAATLSIGLEAPIYLNLTEAATYAGFPLLFGPAFEYHPHQHMAFGANGKVGPTISHAGICSGGLGTPCSTTVAATLGFLTQLFVAYNL